MQSWWAWKSPYGDWGWALTIDSIHEKLNHRFEKIKSEKEKIEKKVLGVYGKQYKQ